MKQNAPRLYSRIGEQADWTDAQVAKSIGCSQALVRKWRKRWCQSRSLKQAKRSGRPRTFLPNVPSQGEQRDFVMSVKKGAIAKTHIPHFN